MVLLQKMTFHIYFILLNNRKCIINHLKCVFNEPPQREIKKLEHTSKLCRSLFLWISLLIATNKIKFATNNTYADTRITTSCMCNAIDGWLFLIWRHIEQLVGISPWSFELKSDSGTADPVVRGEKYERRKKIS